MIRRALTSIVALAVMLAAMLLVPMVADAHPGHDHSGHASGHIHSTAKVTHMAGAGPTASLAGAPVVAAPLIAASATLAAAGPRASTSDSLAAPSADPGLRGAIALMAGACTGSGCTGPSCCPGGACSACGGLTAEAETDPRPPLATIRPVGTPEAIRPDTFAGGLERPPRSFV